MTPNNMISVVVAICFVVFIGLGDTSLVYYAAMLTDSGQKRIVSMIKLSTPKEYRLFILSSHVLEFPPGWLRSSWLILRIRSRPGRKNLSAVNSSGKRGAKERCILGVPY